MSAGAAGVTAGSALLTKLLELKAQRERERREAAREAINVGFGAQKEATQKLTDQEAQILSNIVSQQRQALLS